MDIKYNNIKLGEILNYLQPTNFLIKKVTNEGNIPILTANKSFILGYTSDSKNTFNDLPCLIFDDFTCDIKYIDFPFKLKSSAIKILTLKNKNHNLKYIYEQLKIQKEENFEHKRHWISEYQNKEIKLIDINKQKLIGEFFYKIDQLIEVIKEKNNFFIELKINILNYYFSLKSSDNKKYFIKDIFKITRGNVLAKNKIKLIKDDKYKYPVYSSQTKNNGILGFYDKWLFEKAIIWTTDGANAGNFKYIDNKFYSTNVCGVLISDIYANQSMSFLINNFIKKYISNSGIPKLMNNTLENIKIPIIKNNEQILISDLINKFNLLEEKIKLKENYFNNYKKSFLNIIFKN